MATLNITNVSTEDVYLRDLYTSIAVGESKEIERAASELSAMRSLQAAMAAGKVTLSVAYDADEVGSGLQAPPASVEAGDLAPVDPAVPVAGLAVIYKAFAAGGGGAPDDVEVYPVGALPFKMRVLDMVAYIAVAVGAASVEVRDEPGGAGTLLASTTAAAIGRSPNVEIATAIATPGPTKGLFVRRSDDGVGGELVLTIRPEL